MDMDSFSKWERMSWGMDDFLRRSGLRHLRRISLPQEWRELFSNPDKFHDAIYADGFEITHSALPYLKVVGKDGLVSLVKTSSVKPPLNGEYVEPQATKIPVEFLFTSRIGSDNYYEPRLMVKLGNAEPEDVRALVDILMSARVSFIVVQYDNAQDDLLTFTSEDEDDGVGGTMLTRVDFYQLTPDQSFFYRGFTVEMLLEILRDSPQKLVDGEFANAIRDFLCMYEKGIISELEPAVSPMHFNMISDDSNIEKIRARLVLETIFGDNFTLGVGALSVRKSALYDSFKEREYLCRIMFTQEQERVREIEIWKDSQGNKPDKKEN